MQNQVSWVRRRDWHILSSGESLYTNDARFVATHEPTQSTYTLQIKFVQKRDHGVYECQVSDMTAESSLAINKINPPTVRETNEKAFLQRKSSCRMNNKILCVFNDENFIFRSCFLGVSIQSVIVQFS